MSETIPNHLHVAAYAGQYDVIKKLLRRKASPIDQRDKSGWTALHCGASAGHLKVCKLLIEKGANVGLRNNEGTTALHYLVRITDPSSQRLYNDVMRLMLKRGADVDIQNAAKETPLHAASLKGCVAATAFLCSNSANTNLANEYGDTPLHYAIRSGNKEIAELLIKAGADVWLPGMAGTCVELAESLGQPDILELIKSSPSYKAGLGKKKRSFTSGGSNLPSHLRSQASSTADSPSTSTTTPGKPEASKSVDTGNENVAGGIRRGACQVDGCDCQGYLRETANGGKCQNCGDYPAKHEDLGKLEEGSAGGQDGEESNDPEEAARIIENTMKGGDNNKPLGDMQHSWEIDGREIDFDKKLGEGAAAQVFKGKYRGQDVAIKVLKSLETTQTEDFFQEFEIYSQLRSPHVVLFFGACIRPELCMVFEYCAKGSLTDVLSSQQEEISWSRALKICVDMGKAVNTLHGWKPPIVHRDLKSLNLLVDENWTVKVTDFGLSRFTGNANLSTLGRLRGTYAYSAPEVYYGEPFTTKADVFSTGIVLWEIAMRALTGKYHMPYSEYPELVFDFQIIIKVAKEDKRPTIPDHCPTGFRNLIESCWAKESHDRPDIPEVMSILTRLRADYKQNKDEWEKTAVPKHIPEEEDD